MEVLLFGHVGVGITQRTRGWFGIVEGLYIAPVVVLALLKRNNIYQFIVNQFK